MARDTLCNGGGTHNPTNGPGGQGCHHGTPVDGAAQDNSVKFTCDCDSGFKGANCMQQDSLSVGAIVGIVLAVLAAFGGGAWYYMNSKKKASMSTYGVVPGNPQCRDLALISTPAMHPPRSTPSSHTTVISPRWFRQC